MSFWISYALGAFWGTDDSSKKMKVSIFMENTIPTVFLIIEYPFNMIPVNVRQLPIDLAIYLVWGAVSVIYELVTKQALYGPKGIGSNFFERLFRNSALRRLLS